MDYHEITIQDLYTARKRIKPYINQTPLIKSEALSKICKSNIFLKLENLQLTGSFKPRGVLNHLLTLPKEKCINGVIGTSTGNHGIAIAAMCRELGIHAVVCVSKNAAEYKQKAIRDYGAELVICGDTYDDALLKMQSLARERDLSIIRSFEEPAITAGHGTIAIELIEDLPEVDTVLIPLAAGGLLIGMATLLKACNPRTRIIGVAMEKGSLLVHSLIAGHVVDFIEQETLADALMGGLGEDPNAIVDIVRPFVDDAITVSEEQISNAMMFALEEHHIVVEGAGAVGIAALKDSVLKNIGENVAVILTGGNVDPAILRLILSE